MNQKLSLKITKTILIATCLLLFASVVLLPGWTWSLYDELHWAVIVAESKSPLDFIIPEFKNDGRFWPLSTFYHFLYYNFSDFNPVTLRVLRCIEFSILIGLLYRYLRKQNYAPLAILFAVLFFVKSPPQMEQLRWMSLVEEPLCVLVILGLLTYQKSKSLSYFLIALAILGKEPFILFLCLPSLLAKQRREFIICLLIQFAYLTFFILNRKGYSAAAPVIFQPHVIREILKQGTIDIALAVPFIFFIKKNINWSTLVFFIFSIGYFVLVSPKTWGYTYLIMPSILMLSISIAGLLNSVFLDLNTLKKKKMIEISAFIISLIFLARFGLNWTNVYASMSLRKEAVDYIASNYKNDPVSTTCHVDYRNIGYAADLKNNIKVSTRPNGNSCPSLRVSIYDCCKSSSIMAIGRECDNWDARKSEVAVNNYPILFSNKRWMLLDCAGVAQSMLNPGNPNENKGP